VLRTLGLDRAQARGIVAWELAPLAVVSVVAGGVLGVLVPWVVVGAMDLTALTGGEEQPGLVVDPLVVGAVLGGVVAVTALAVVVSTMTSSRADAATELRMGEET
jgi:putative ABC transport system permease protein